MVAVGSANRAKVEAVERVFTRVYGGVELRAVEVDSGVPEQPFGGDTLKGARNRAEAAFSNGVDFSVGIEAGLFSFPVETGYLDLQFCSLFDGATHSLGCGPGFQYPGSVLEEVLAGSTVGQTIEKLAGEKGPDEGKGAIGVLSGGLTDRTHLTEQAVLMALVPRIQDL